MAHLLRHARAHLKQQTWWAVSPWRKAAEAGASMQTQQTSLTASLLALLEGRVLVLDDLAPEPEPPPAAPAAAAPPPRVPASRGVLAPAARGRRGGPGLVWGPHVRAREMCKASGAVPLGLWGWLVVGPELREALSEAEAEGATGLGQGLLFSTAEKRT